MADRFDLKKMLQEIKEEEDTLQGSEKKTLSQDEIKRMLRAKRKSKDKRIDAEQ